jgi:hypothetical protein
VSLPTPRAAGSLAAQIPDSFSRAEAKTLARLQNAELTHGLVKATRIQTAAVVAGVGLQCVGMLSREARFQEDGDPAAANRLQFVVDQFANFVGREVAQL